MMRAAHTLVDDIVRAASGGDAIPAHGVSVFAVVDGIKTIVFGKGKGRKVTAVESEKRRHKMGWDGMGWGRMQTRGAMETKPRPKELEGTDPG
jgi:hypothetical protein